MKIDDGAVDICAVSSDLAEGAASTLREEILGGGGSEVRERKGVVDVGAGLI